MRFLFGSLLTFLIGAVLGLAATWMALNNNTAFGAVGVGAWTSWPKTGTSGIDPYARATISRTGELPVGLGDGVAFFARVDDTGDALDGRCDIAITGTTPPARFWTITIYDLDGGLIANANNRYGFTSQEITRKADGSFEILVSARARPGNWLPTAGIDRYTLVLRLYDTPVGVATRASREVPMPAVTRRGCP